MGSMFDGSGWVCCKESAIASASSCIGNCRQSHSTWDGMTRPWTDSRQTGPSALDTRPGPAITAVNTQFNELFSSAASFKL